MTDEEYDFEVTFLRVVKVKAKTPGEAEERASEKLTEALNECQVYRECFEILMRVGVY